MSAVARLVRGGVRFSLLLALNGSRWGRFQDTDLAAHYESLCRQHGKEVIYADIGFTENENALITQLRKNVDRFRSAETIRTLSKGTFDGAVRGDVEVGRCRRQGAGER